MTSQHYKECGILWHHNVKGLQNCVTSFTDDAYEEKRTLSINKTFNLENMSQQGCKDNFPFFQISLYPTWFNETLFFNVSFGLKVEKKILVWNIFRISNSFSLPSFYDTHSRINTHTRTHAFTHTHTYTHTYTRIYTHSHVAQFRTQAVQNLLLLVLKIIADHKIYLPSTQ